MRFVDALPRGAVKLVLAAACLVSLGVFAATAGAYHEPPAFDPPGSNGLVPKADRPFYKFGSTCYQRVSRQFANIAVASQTGSLTQYAASARRMRKIAKRCQMQILKKGAGTPIGKQARKIASNAFRFYKQAASAYVAAATASAQGNQNLAVQKANKASNLQNKAGAKLAKSDKVVRRG